MQGLEKGSTVRVRGHARLAEGPLGGGEEGDGQALRAIGGLGVPSKAQGGVTGGWKLELRANRVNNHVKEWEGLLADSVGIFSNSGKGFQMSW